MDGTNPGLPEPSGGDERGGMVWGTRDYESNLLLPSPPCPGGLPGWLRPGEMVPVSRELMASCQGKEKEPSPQGGLDLEWNQYTIHVTVDTDPSLLASVLRVIRHAE